MASIVRRTAVALRRTETGWRFLFNIAPTLWYRRNRPALAGEAPRVLGDLNRDGVAMVPAAKLLGPVSVYDELEQEIFRLENEMAGELAKLRAAAVDASSLERKSFLCELLGEKPVLDPGSVFTRFALQDQILGIANAYFGMYTRMRAYNIWHSFVTDAPPRQSQLWHRDREDRLILKVFVYLCNVDEHTGPFTYAPGTHAKGPVRRAPESFSENGVNRSTDEQMARVVPRDRWITALAPKGTIVFADTHGYHKGGEARRADRLLYMCMFTSPASESKELLTRSPAAIRFPDLARTVALAPPRRKLWLSLPQPADA